MKKAKSIVEAYVEEAITSGEALTALLRIWMDNEITDDEYLHCCECVYNSCLA